MGGIKSVYWKYNSWNIIRRNWLQYNSNVSFHILFRFRIVDPFCFFFLMNNLLTCLSLMSYNISYSSDRQYLPDKLFWLIKSINSHNGEHEYRKIANMTKKIFPKKTYKFEWHIVSIIWTQPKPFWRAKYRPLLHAAESVCYESLYWLENPHIKKWWKHTHTLHTHTIKMKLWDFYEKKKKKKLVSKWWIVRYDIRKSGRKKNKW